MIMKLLFIILLSTRIFTDLRLFSENLSFYLKISLPKNWHQLQADYESFTEYNHGRDGSASCSFSSYSSSSFALFSDPQEIDLSSLPFNRTLVGPFFITKLFIFIITDLQVRFHLILRVLCSITIKWNAFRPRGNTCHAGGSGSLLTSLLVWLLRPVILLKVGNFDSSYKNILLLLRSRDDLPLKTELIG